MDSQLGVSKSVCQSTSLSPCVMEKGRALWAGGRGLASVLEG